MKGIIFTELMGFIEEVAGIDFAERVLDRADLPNGGAFTSVGTYPGTHALAIVGAASELGGIPAEKLCSDYGEWLFARFAVLYPAMIEQYADADSMLAHVESHIHEEVTLLYPDANPPKVEMEGRGEEATVRYASHRPLAHIALGLIRGCLAHYGDPRAVEWNPGRNLRSAEFRLVRKAETSA